MNAIRSFSSNDRIELEQRILGGMLLENGFSKVSRILSARNFSKKYHREIWNACFQLYPKNPIDIQSVHHWLKIKKGISIPNLLINCCLMVNSSAHLDYWSFVLLELDIASKFMKIVNNTGIAGSDLVFKAAIQEIQLKIQNDQSDLLQTLDDASEYLTTLNPDHILTKKVVEFNELISKKAGEVRNYSSAKTLLEHITKLGSGYSFTKKLIVDQLIEMIIIVVNKSDLPEDFIQNIATLKKNLLV